MGNFHGLLCHNRRGGVHHARVDWRYDDFGKSRALRPLEQLLLRKRRVVRRRGLPGQTGRFDRHTERGYTSVGHCRRSVRVRCRGDRANVAVVFLLSIDHRIPGLWMVAHIFRYGYINCTTIPRGCGITSGVRLGSFRF